MTPIWLNQISRDQLQDHVTGITTSGLAPLAIGGYREQRRIYAIPTEAGIVGYPPTVHLGIDVWGATDTVVRAPLDGVVAMARHCPGPGDYGTVVVVDHGGFGVMYAHLRPDVLTRLHPGMTIQAGDVIGHMGAPADNGEWPSHVHI